MTLSGTVRHEGRPEKLSKTHTYYLDNAQKR